MLRYVHADARAERGVPAAGSPLISSVDLRDEGLARTEVRAAHDQRATPDRDLDTSSRARDGDPDEDAAPRSTLGVTPEAERIAGGRQGGAPDADASRPEVAAGVAASATSPLPRRGVTSVAPLEGGSAEGAPPLPEADAPPPVLGALGEAAEGRLAASHVPGAAAEGAVTGTAEATADTVGGAAASSNPPTATPRPPQPTPTASPAPPAAVASSVAPFATAAGLPPTTPARPPAPAPALPLPASSALAAPLAGPSAAPGAPAAAPGTASDADAIAPTSTLPAVVSAPNGGRSAASGVPAPIAATPPPANAATAGSAALVTPVDLDGTVPAPGAAAATPQWWVPSVAMVDPRAVPAPAATGGPGASAPAADGGLALDAPASVRPDAARSADGADAPLAPAPDASRAPAVATATAPSAPVLSAALAATSPMSMAPQTALHSDSEALDADRSVPSAATSPDLRPDPRSAAIPEAARLPTAAQATATPPLARAEAPLAAPPATAPVVAVASSRALTGASVGLTAQVSTPAAQPVAGTTPSAAPATASTGSRQSAAATAASSPVDADGRGNPSLAVALAPEPDAMDALRDRLGLGTRAQREAVQQQTLAGSPGASGGSASSAQAVLRDVRATDRVALSAVATPLGRYEADVEAAIREAWSVVDLPAVDRLLGVGGDVILTFHIHRSGRRSEVRILRSSGHRALDTLAVAAIPDRFPSFPRDLELQGYEHRLTLTYRNDVARQGQERPRP